MESRRLLDRDPHSGITEYYHFDPETQGFVIEYEQDVEGIIEMNKWAANKASDGWKGEFHHVACIPLTIMMKLAEQGIVTVAGQVLDQKRYKAWLNDPANAHFRVKRGRV